MRISVVIPAYDRADLIPETLDAILGQTLVPFEVIVVDDGSRDATWEVLQSYASRVRSIRIENSGDLVARNAGLRLATGELVAFCDSDDLWRPDFLEAMAGLIRASVVRRRLDALESAFARREFAVVRETAALIGPGALTGRARLKAWVAGLPGPLANAAASLLFLPAAVKAASDGR